MSWVLKGSGTHFTNGLWAHKRKVCVVHDGVIKWKHSPRYWPFVRGNQRSPVDSLHNGQWRIALMFSLICAWSNGWANNRCAGDLIRHPAHYNLTVMMWLGFYWFRSRISTRHDITVVIIYAKLSSEIILIFHVRAAQILRIRFATL